jgi:hypothetical protein
MQREKITDKTEYEYGDFVRTPNGYLAIVNDVDYGRASIAFLNASDEKLHGWKWGELKCVDPCLLDESDYLFKYWEEKCLAVGVKIKRYQPFTSKDMEEYKQKKIDEMLELKYRFDTAINNS